jgi:hypothetical protein
VARAARAVHPRGDSRGADARGLWAAHAFLVQAACNIYRDIVLSFSCAVANRQGTERPFLLRKIVGMSREGEWVWVRQSGSAQWDACGSAVQLPDNLVGTVCYARRHPVSMSFSWGTYWGGVPQ